MKRNNTNPASRRESQAQRAVSGIGRLAEVQLELALSLAQELEETPVVPEDGPIPSLPDSGPRISRRQRQARLARISGTLAEINEQIEEALSSDNRTF